MRLLKHVDVGPFRVRIFHDSSLLDDDSFGQWRPSLLEIGIRPGMCALLEKETLQHELDHVIAFVAGMSNGAHDDEAWATRTSPIRLDMLRRNPPLVRYLTSQP